MSSKKPKGPGSNKTNKGLPKNKGMKSIPKNSRLGVLLDKQLWSLLLPPAVIAAGIAFYIYKKTNSTLAVSVLLLGIAVPLHVRFLDSRDKGLRFNAGLSLAGTLVFLLLALINMVMPLSSWLK